MSGFTQNRNMELTSLKLYQEDSQYYLSAKYHWVTPYKECDFIIPKIKFPFPNSDPNIEFTRDRDPDNGWQLMEQESAYLNWYIPSLEICRDENNSFTREENVKEFSQEVTMEEVERKFGHKVKIVREKSK